MLLALADACSRDDGTGRPAWSSLADDEALGAGWALVAATGPAFPGSRARDRTDVGAADVKGPNPGDLHSCFPHAAHLADEEPLTVARAVPVLPAGTAVPRRKARH